MSASDTSDWEMVILEEVTIIPREDASDNSLARNS
jgi:hypothetical protein